jgi:hypothetical protein
MFVSTTKGLPAIICEDCYRSTYHSDPSFIKAYKHCILGEAITPPISRKICHCKDVAHHDPSGKPLALFPVDREANHFDVGGAGTIQCSLLKLGEIVALAKYQGLQSMAGISKPPKLSSGLVSNEDMADRTNAGLSSKRSWWGPKEPKTTTKTSLQDPATRTVTEPMADRDIPMFFRKFASKYPFGNVHMALRVGPLVIENGVAQ